MNLGEHIQKPSVFTQQMHWNLPSRRGNVSLIALPKNQNDGNESGKCVHDRTSESQLIPSKLFRLHLLHGDNHGDKGPGRLGKARSVYSVYHCEAFASSLHTMSEPHWVTPRRLNSFLGPLPLGPHSSLPPSSSMENTLQNGVLGLPSDS